MNKVKRKHQLRVYVNGDEKERIEYLVTQVSSWSVSDYLRTLALGYEPKSIIDKKVILELAKISGDQGRLGGLLKMWLTNEERHDAVTYEAVSKTLLDIQEVQSELLRLVDKL